MSRIDDLRAAREAVLSDAFDADHQSMAILEALPALLDVASAAERTVRDVRTDGTFTISYADLATLRAALDRLEASTHDASGGPPATHRRPSEEVEP